ncbi:hypothetical protein [Agromyces laixinhei]|uniref:hypothetical protein n=1 Tax=Agromyces laixinhei TaxID=2585717 RepID=UPI0012EDDC9E|nr:hypothetical protein [Agromyces laixinhei]
MKRTLSALTIAVLGAGLAVVGVAAPATASTPAVTASCISLNVNLTDYSTDPGAPEVTEEVVVTPAVDEVSHTDFQYKTTRFDWSWPPSPYTAYRWAHKDSGSTVVYDWEFWTRTNVTQKHVEVEGQPAVTETVVVTPAVPANPTPNTVTVEIGGDVVVDGAAFGESFSQSFDLDKYTEQAYTVTVTSFDGEGAGVVAEGTSSACALGAANAAATIAAASCGTVDLAITNVALAEDAINPTTSAVVYIDGAATHFHAVAENATETRTLSFPEDSGDREVVVRTGPAHGDLVLATATVPTDCEENPVEPNTGELSVTGSFVPGGAITITGTDFEPNTEYDVELHSPVQALGTVTTDENGDFTLPATIGADTTIGDHDVVVLLEGEEVASTGITVTAATTPGGSSNENAAPADTTTPAGTTTPAAAKTGLAETGVDANGIMLIALAALLLGGAAFGVTRAARARA